MIILMIPEDMGFYFRDFTEKNIQNSWNIQYISTIFNINLQVK